MEKLVIIPTYNEKENILSIIDAVFDCTQDFHILIIDDNSPDGTANLVKSAFPKYPGRLFLEQRMGKLGLGTAIIAAMHYAIEHGYDHADEFDVEPGG